jgi:hypothetical protein
MTPKSPYAGSQVPQDLFHGGSIEQLDGLVDLLMNFDLYASQRSLIAPLVKEQAQGSEEEGLEAEEAAAVGADAPTEGAEQESTDAESTSVAEPATREADVAADEAD